MKSQRQRPAISKIASRRAPGPDLHVYPSRRRGGSDGISVEPQGPLHGPMKGSSTLLVLTTSPGGNTPLPVAPRTVCACRLGVSGAKQLFT